MQHFNARRMLDSFGIASRRVRIAQCVRRPQLACLFNYGKVRPFVSAEARLSALTCRRTSIGLMDPRRSTRRHAFPHNSLLDANIEKKTTNNNTQLRAYGQ